MIAEDAVLRHWPVSDAWMIKVVPQSPPHPERDRPAAALSSELPGMQVFSSFPRRKMRTEGKRRRKMWGQCH